MRRFSVAAIICFVGSYHVQASAASFLRWTGSVAEVIKPLKVEVDDLNKDVGVVFVHVTYEMLKSCKSLYLFSKSVSQDDVTLNQASVTHSGVVTGQKFRDTFSATYMPGHHVELTKVSCL